jgi:hypothetical protein
MRKDLRIMSRHPLVVASVMLSLILSVAMNLRGVAAASGQFPVLLAATAPILLQIVYHELMTMEGSGGEHLAPFAVNAMFILVGKTLSAFLLNLPLPLLGMIMLSASGLSVGGVAFLVLWVTWLPPVIVIRLAIAGVFARRKATRLTESRAPLSFFVGLPVQILFAVSFAVFAAIAEAEPLVAIVGAGFHLLLAWGLLRLSVRVLRLMQR